MAEGSVRVDPPVIEFKDVEVGHVYRRAVTVTNVGKTSKKITIEKPALKLFSFDPSSRAESVPSGLSVSGFLEFAPEAEEEVRDHIRVHVDDVETLQIPVLGSPRACRLVTASLLDFGCVVASSQVVRKLHPVTNEGSAAGAFHVELSGVDSSLSVSPLSGVVAAGSTRWLKVELHTDRPRRIHDRALVRLQNASDVVLRIRAEVVEQRLQVLDLKGSLLTCLWFGPVYFGTSRVKKVVLRNSGPQACDWVCLLQETAAGTERGTDLWRSTDAALVEGMKKRGSAERDLTPVLVCAPSHGRLGPHDRTTVTVCFSPVCNRKSCDSSSSRRDYCLFLLFDIVDSKHGFTYQNATSSVEVAVTGSGVPVSLAPAPSHRFDFLSCALGQSLDLLCVLRNLCPQLPVSFRFSKVAHFTAEPSAGTIGPGQCQDVVLTFRARQQGSVHVRQRVDVLGSVVSQKDATELEVSCFHTVTLHLSATCHSVTTPPLPGRVSRRWGPTCSAVLGSAKTQLHKHRRDRRGSAKGKELLAFPDDRACSIRPASSDKQYRTVFTGVPRYRYVDKDYAFTEEEEERRRRHRQIYVGFIKQLGQTRLQRVEDRQQEKTEDDVDIGLVPREGLVPPTVHIRDLEPSENSASLTQRPISQVLEAMKTVPSSSQEVADCTRTLTALQLYQVIISPLFVDFGSVCVDSVCVRTLRLANGLPAYVWVQLEVDSPELQGSSPLSYVLPPHTQTSFPLTFESNQLGPFCSSLSYSVNQQHPGQILVRAQVAPMALALSTKLLVLRPNPNTLAASGYRSSVSLRNQCNCAVDFTWQPAATESDFLFSIRPATGTVEPYKELDCEVMWFPSFSSPSEGDFDLIVHEGNTQRLHCVAKVGTTTVQLAEKRLVFESVPLNLTSTRTAVLHNTGQNHAYYQVLDVCPVPGMMVSPCEGVVPSWGLAPIDVHFNPDSIIRFDAKVKIALRNMKSIELRVAGSVEPPNVDVSVPHFQFSGVHAGSRQVIPFRLTNRSAATARVTFDLSEYEDFSVQLSQPCTNTGNTGAPEAGPSVVELHDGQTEECFLVFSPTQVVSHDFYLPLMINGARWPADSSSPSSASPSPTADSRSHIKAYPQSVAMATQQPPWVQATALHAPLDMSPTKLQFNVEPQVDTCSQTVQLKAAGEDRVCWRAVTAEGVRWWFDCSVMSCPAQGSTEQQLCLLSPSSGALRPAQTVGLVVSVNPAVLRTGEKVTKLSIPLYLGVKGEERHEGHCPYRELSVTVTLELPNITFSPRQILLTPVPLARSIETTLTLLAEGYQSGTRISAEVDEVEMEDGTKIQPVSVIFPEGNSIQAQDQNQENKVPTLLCIVSFCSTVPLSLCTTITFTDHINNRFLIKLCAVAENCLLTVWPYMALHPLDQQVVLKTGGAAEEAILQYRLTPHLTASDPTASSSSSSSFDYNSSTYKNSDSSYSDSGSEESSGDTSPNRDTPTSLGVPEFPAAGTEAGQYYQSVLLAVERWFSLFGWPSGPHPISVPHTLRRVVSKSQTNFTKHRTYGVILNKDTRSVVEMLHYLTGRQIPGVGVCQTFSTDADQRTNQLLQQHEAMLDFLRVQGARLCHIRPEYLLDVLEFQHWCSVQSNTESGLDFNSSDYESLSKRSWTDVLLQIYKVVVLCRVSAGGLNTPPHVTDGFSLGESQSLVSNVYSAHELRLLSWLNVHYQRMRETVWSADGVPAARWIVNFDLDFTDGLVLAALLAAYCPYLIKSHFRRIYTTVSSLEQILHNNLIVAQALTTLGVNMDIQLTDLSDSNPVQMLVLCVHLYEVLPHYLSSHTMTLSGGLHSTVSKQVRLKNPSSQPVKYRASVLGEDARFFSLPTGSVVTIPPKSNTALTVQVSCYFLRPMKAVLLLSSTSGLHCAARTFNLKTLVSHVTPTSAVQCSSPCYQLRVAEVQITNKFSKEANFRVVLVESNFNPLEPQQEPANDNRKKMASDFIDGWEMEDDEDSEFLSTVRTVGLQSGQSDTLRLLYLPFFPGTKYCTVLLTCPQVGDMVYMVKATAELPLPSPLFAKPSSDSGFLTKNSDTGVSALRLHCQVGDVCEAVLQAPRVNKSWENALAVWAQHCISAGERRRWLLSHTLYSSTVRASTATHKFIKQPLDRGNLKHGKGIKYDVEVSSPQYFTLPKSVVIPVEEEVNVLQEHPADCVNIPLRFQADSAGRFTANVVLTSFCDTRVFLLEALVTSQDKLSGHNGDGTEPEFTPRGQGERPLLVEHVVLSCPVGTTTYTQLEVPNHSLRQLSLKVQTNLSVVSGAPILEIKPGHRCLYTLAVTPWRRGKQTGSVSFVQTDDVQEADKDKVHYACFSLELICEPAAPVKVISAQCVTESAVTMEIPVSNPGEELLMLDVFLEGGSLTGASSVSVPPRGTVSYRASFSPVSVGKIAGSVVFQSEQVGEFWYQLDLYALPPPVIKLPEARCLLGKWIQLNVPLVNPTPETLELILTNTNPRNYTLEMDSANTLMVEPRSFTHLGVRFRPSVVGQESHQGKITFKCSQLQEWCVLLTGRGLKPEWEEPLCVSTVVGSTSSITILFTNPMELPATVTVALTDENPNESPTCRPVTDKKAFCCPLSHAEGVHISGRATVAVPVVFAPNSVGLQEAWLCVTMTPISTRSNNVKSSSRSEEDCWNSCWIYPLCGISTEVPAENSPLGVVQCEVGRQLEKSVEVQLTGYTPPSPDQKGHGVLMEAFRCQTRADSEAEQSALSRHLTVTPAEAKRDPENGIIILTLRLVYTPLRTCRCSGVVLVQSQSGRKWEFPIVLIAKVSGEQGTCFLTTRQQTCSGLMR